MQSPTVSVLIPTYNYAEYIGVAIESVLQQTFTDFELIVVDDDSSDDTEAVVKKYLSDSRIRFYKNRRNLGLPGNWNRCLSLARGRYIKFLMADDKFHPSLLQKMIAVFGEHPGVSLVTSCKEYLDAAHNVTREYCPPHKYLQHGKAAIYDSLKTFNWIGEPTTVMFRRENLNLGSFDTSYSWIPDWEMWIRHLCIGDLYIIPEVLSCFRIHERQATAYLSKTLKRQAEEYKFYKYLKSTCSYGLDLTKIDIRSILKRKSYQYLRSSTKALLLLRKGSVPLFGDALQTYLKEHFRFG